MNSVNLDAILTAVSQKGYLIDDQLKIRTKFGFTWILLFLKMPFYCLMGWDVFEHVKVDQVAQSLLKHYKNNNNVSLETIVKIIEALDKKTVLKYHKKVGKALQVLSRVNSVTNLVFTWPPDMEAATQQEVDEKIRRAIQQKFLLSSDEDNEQEDRLHVCFKERYFFSLNIFISQNKVSKVFLIYKIPIKKGGERSIKESFELLTGLKCIKKPLKPIEPELYKSIDSQFHNRVGILPEYFFMYTSTAMGPVSTTVYEKYYQRDLEEVLLQKGLSTIREKFQVIEQLITGLSFFHTLSDSAPQRQFESKGVSVMMRPFYLPCFHKDVKPANILFSRSNNGIEVRLTDFGFANSVARIGCTVAYRSWDTWNHYFYKTKDLKEDLKTVIDYNSHYGQSMDMWAMGGVFAAILLNDLKKFSSLNLLNQPDEDLIPPLNSYQDFFRGALAFARRESAELPSPETTQRKINEEIRSIKDSLSGADSAILCSLWDVVAEMLIVKSDKRISAKYAYDKILEMKSRYSM